MKKIISIGEVLIDIYSTENKEEIQVGGASFNVSCSIAALNNNESYFMGSLGNDSYKKNILEVIEKYGIKTDFIQHSVLPTTVAKVILDENKDRFFEFTRNSDADFILSKIPQEKLKVIDFIHFGSATGLLDGDLKHSYWELFKYAKENNIKFSFDPNFRDQFWITSYDIKEFIRLCRPFLDNADLIKLSEEELFVVTGMIKVENALKSLMKYNPKALICITRGTKDTMFGWKGEIGYIPIVKYNDLVDTTGAGDAFISSIIDEFVKEGIDENSSKEQIIEVIKKSNKFANKSTGFIGALSFLEYLY